VRESGLNTGVQPIIDFCEDGIADNHPEWIVSKENGRKFIDWTAEDFRKELSKL